MSSTKKKLDRHLQRRLSEEGKQLFRQGLVAPLEKWDALKDSNKMEECLHSKVSEADSTTSVQVLHEALDHLQEKRESSKVKGLQQICEILKTYDIESLLSFHETLLSNFMDCYHKPERESAVLATQAIALLVITLGTRTVFNYEELSLKLKQLAINSQTSELRMECLYTLSILCFVCSLDESCIWDVISVCGNVLHLYNVNNSDHLDILAAVDCWGFLVSCFDASIVIPKIYDPSSIIYRHVKLMGNLSYFNDPDLRSGICDNLGMLVEMKISISPWKCHMEMEDSSLYQLDDKIQDLMHQSAKQIGKKTRKSQRKNYRKLIQTMETGEGPHHEYTIGNSTLLVTSWTKEIQLKMLKRSLQGGLQSHLFSNPLLREIFQVKDNISQDNQTSFLTGLEKRTYLSKKSESNKQKTNHLKSNRLQRYKEKQSFLFDSD